MHSLSEEILVICLSGENFSSTWKLFDSTVAHQPSRQASQIVCHLPGNICTSSNKAGKAYKFFYRIFGLNICCRPFRLIPWLYSIFKAYIIFVHENRIQLTCSFIDKFFCSTKTPRFFIQLGLQPQLLVVIWLSSSLWKWFPSIVYNLLSNNKLLWAAQLAMVSGSHPFPFPFLLIMFCFNCVLVKFL